MRWALVVLLACEGALLARAPAPAPRRRPLAASQANEAAMNRLVEAVWHGREERVTFVVPRGEAWRCPRLRRRDGVESRGLSPDGGTSGLSLDGGLSVWGGFEARAERPGSATITLHYGGERSYRVVITLVFGGPRR
jgi:hypothetical protein